MVERDHADLPIVRSMEIFGPAAFDQPLIVLCDTVWRERRQLVDHGRDRPAVPRHAVLWRPTDDLASAIKGLADQRQAGPTFDAQDGSDTDLSTAENQHAGASRTDDRLCRSLDWCSRKVLAWRLSNTMEARFCVDTLEEAMDRHGKPKIFNSDQGSQFTSFDFTRKLKAAGIRISMDGKGRWLDNVFVERPWRSLK